jgi:hypothetical protein
VYSIVVSIVEIHPQTFSTVDALRKKNSRRQTIATRNNKTEIPTNMLAALKGSFKMVVKSRKSPTHDKSPPHNMSEIPERSRLFGLFSLFVMLF